jgi:hypothetical protein
MDRLNDHDYYVARAKTCREMAARAASPAIAAIHAELATRYEAGAAGYVNRPASIPMECRFLLVA